MARGDCAAVLDYVPLITEAEIVLPELPVLPEPNLADIARRWPASVPCASLSTQSRNVQQCNRPPPRNPRDIAHLQFAWRRYIANIRRTCSASFWKFFLPMHTLSTKAIDTALHCAKNAFLSHRDVLRGHMPFPLSTRTLFAKIKKTVPPFWHRVMHSVDIDLRAFRLPPNKRSLTFEFVDPLWAWVRAASDQPPQEMQWIPQFQTRSGYPSHLLYGGGLQFGEAFAEAYRTCPAGTFPMCVSLHWDGSSAHGLSATPICIGVANTNSMAATTQYCIGYMPVVSDLGDAFANDATELKYYIRNQSIAAILRVLEVGARSGVRCRLPSTTPGAEEDMILMPKLFSMNLDQPEAQLYFGMLNRT